MWKILLSFFGTLNTHTWKSVLFFWQVPFSFHFFISFYSSMILFLFIAPWTKTQRIQRNFVGRSALISFSLVKMCQKIKTSVKSANDDTAALNSTSFRRKSNSTPEKKILKLAWMKPYETIWIVWLGLFKYTFVFVGIIAFIWI